MSDIVKRVEELLKLPQHLCNTCGRCCRIATFKGGLSYEEIKKLAESKDADPIQADGARDFLTIFVPYESMDEAKKFAPGFIDSVYSRFGDESKVSFFYCRYIGENNLCKIHEDRPLLCRMYPVPHEKTLFNPGCGFEEQCKINWAEIKKILEDLEKRGV